VKPLRTLPLQQLRLRENQLFLALTLVVGILAGLSAVMFAIAIDWASRLFFGMDPTAGRLFLVPVVISVIAGVLLAKVFPDVRGSGIPQTKAAFHLRQGEIPARVAVGKFLMGVLCIGGGHSVGREGPSVQIGAGDAMPYMPRSPCRRTTSSRDSRCSRPSIRAVSEIRAKCSIVSIR